MMDVTGPRRRFDPRSGLKTAEKVVCMRPGCLGRKAFVYGSGDNRKYKCTTCGHEFE